MVEGVGEEAPLANACANASSHPLCASGLFVVENGLEGAIGALYAVKRVDNDSFVEGLCRLLLDAFPENSASRFIAKLMAHPDAPSAPERPTDVAKKIYGYLVMGN